MNIKDKVIGIILIAIGALPFLLNVEAVDKFFTDYQFLSYILPGEIIYQVVLIILGALLILRFRVGAYV